MVIGIFLITDNYFQEKVEKAYNKMNLKILAFNDEQERLTHLNEGTDEGMEEEITDETEIVEIKEEKKKPVTYDYIGKIIIKKIGLERGFVSKNSKYNSVDYGIETHKISDYPNVSKGNLILLSHSGTSYRSFFRNLYKLSIGDECIIEYQGKEYKYVIKKIYNKPKIGKITIDRDYNKTTLTLITCTHNSKTEQTVYIAELV